MYFDRSRKASIWLRTGDILTVFLNRNAYEESIGDQVEIRGSVPIDGKYKSAQAVITIENGKIKEMQKLRRYHYEK